jgi:hypothetical protein
MGWMHGCFGNKNNNFQLKPKLFQKKAAFDVILYEIPI